MKRVITSLSLLLLLLCRAYAQDISQYEYWTDDDYASRSVVNSSGGNISFDISTASLSAGIHFFNFRALRSDGVWGNFYRYLYYIPELKKAETGNLKMEYWLDDNYASKTVGAGEDASLAISLDGLSCGVHYFNCRVYREGGEYGNPIRKLFYIPYTKVNTNPSIASAEYWLDDDYANKVSVSGSDTQRTFAIDISHLGCGIHYFNYRAVDNKGQYGNIIRQMFYIAQKDVTTGEDIAGYEYWIDDDVEHKVKGTDSKTEYVFSVDISGLAKGNHTFHFRAMNIFETWGETFSENFEITEDLIPEITITSQDVQMVYGEAVPTLSYNVSGGTLEGNPIVKTNATSTSPVGTYPITVEQGTVTYGNVKYVSGTLTIVKAPLKIIADNVSRKQGEDNPVLTVSYEGFKNNETASVLTSQPAVSTTATKDSEPGTYEITVSSAEAQNYEITYVSGTLTITAGTFKLTYMVDGEEYNSEQLEYGSTITPLVVPDKDTYLFTGWSEIPQTMPAHDVVVTGTYKRHFDMGHVVKVIDFILNDNAAQSDVTLFDLNNDVTLSVGDIILMMRYILNSMSRASATRATVGGMPPDLAQYTAAQFVLQAPLNVTEKDIRLAKSVAQTHQMMCKEIEPGVFAVAVYSMTNSLFIPTNGAIIEVDAEGTHSGDLSIGNVLLAKPTGETERFDNLPVLTPVTDVERESETGPVYDLKGQKRNQGKALRKGIYIKNGKKSVVR